MSSSAARAPRPQYSPSQIPGLDEADERSWQYFFESSTQLYETLNRILVDVHQLTLLDVLLLDELDRSEGSVRMGDLSETLILLPSRVSQQVRRLESRGLVRRDPSTHDRRSVLASITRDGRERVIEVRGTYAQAIRDHYLAHLSRQQMVAMSEGARRLSDGLKNSGHQPEFSRI
ncbi:DNA-binding MarR family transcriptional regulator [Mycobacterium frederiksbergense]|uniref:DNA-binding MarR family transcriptional regulator n=1 Tax=Mycolicibacterium frederiksbergense TaxID=117567 RepID=A0ABT6L8N2_9MYCO|nr:MarR family transcriptional regulator [Mycolicibacterium frederiksbergense]MDH6199312.1 DNA-binding MarR family transcriptional regulator [Mycolicibacterium frederiksbergense]